MSKAVQVGCVRVVHIEPEPDGTCELCGKVAETRPYGPAGERICYECGMKDKAGTDRMMAHVLFGKPLDS